MAAVYSTQFLLVDSVGAGSHPLGVVPAGYVWVLRELDAYCTVTSATGCALFEVTVGPVFFATGARNAGLSVQWQGRAVFPAGQEPSFYVYDGNWSALVSGYVLSA